jgi:pimeloyl-ACP methyl ester carboxylesterase
MRRRRRSGEQRQVPDLAIKNTKRLRGTRAAWEGVRERRALTRPDEAMTTILTAVDSTANTQPTVLCLHASGSSARQWNALVERIGPRANVLPIDLYGHGGAPSWSEPRPMTLRDEADRALRVLFGCGRPVHLVGHSYGGAVALAMAIDQPDRIGSITLYEPVPFATLFAYDPRSAASIEVRTVADGIDRSLRNGHIEAAAERFVTYWSGADGWHRLGGPQRTTIASRMPSVDRHFKALASESPRLNEYKQLRVPVLLMAGARTRASTRRLAELLSFALPKCEVETFEGLEHMGPVTAPDVVNGRIEDFLSQWLPTSTQADSYLRAAAA